MNAKQNDKIRMYLSTQAVLTVNEETWKSHEAFSEGVEELVEVVLGIDQVAQKQVGKNGASDAKSLAQFLLGESAYEVAGATYACAVKSGNTELSSRVEFSRSEVTRGSTVAVAARCQNILTEAVEVAEALGKYGVTAAKLTALRKRIETYRKAQTKPRESQTDSKAATKALPKLIDQADSILSSQLDKLVVQFKETAPDFYNKYTAARLIVGRAGGRSATEVKVVAAPATGPSSKAA